MLNHKTIFKQKSKILLTIICIFGLAFSYSCSCRSPEEPPTGSGTFAPRLDLGNSYNVSFTSAGVEKLHASVKFIEPNKYDYKAEITEVTDGKGEITKDKIQYNDDGTFTIETSILQALAGKLDSTDKPATNEVSITFKLTSTDTSLNNNTTNITKTFNFIKAKKIDNDGMQTLLRSAYSDTIQFKSDDFLRLATVVMHNGNYNGMLETFTLNENSNDLKDGDNVISAEDIKTQVTAYIKNGPNTKDYFVSGDGVISGNITPELQNRGDKISWDVTFKFGDLYESDISKIKIEFTKTKGGWKD